MKPRILKFWRDHIFSRQHDWQLRLDLSQAEHRYPADENGLHFTPVETVDDPLLEMLDRDFPRQSRSFRSDIKVGCVMMVLADETRTLGYFFSATRDYNDKRQYKRTFAAGGGSIYSFNFYVDPDVRTRPVARVLLSEGFHWLAAQGNTEMFAIVRSQEKALVRLYRQFKMFPTGRGLDTYQILHQRRSFWTDKRG